MALFGFLELIAAQVPHELFLIFEIGIMIIIAGIIGYVLKLLKQPLILGYIIAGVILGPLSVGLIQNNETILVLSEIGVAFLLFFAGLEIHLGKLKEVGKASIFGGAIQIILSFIAGYFVASWLGLTGTALIYTGLVVSFSSTMVVLKMFADKRQLNSLHGRIVLGILLVQDIVAIIALTILTTDLAINNIAIQLVKALGFVIVTFILVKVVNPIFRIAARNTELLLLVSVSLLFIFAIASYVAGLSLIIGAFFAGLALASSEYRIEIQGKIMPLRDFFAVIFFVALGMQLTFISTQFILILISLIAIVMIFKPIILMILTRISGYSKRTSFLTGNALGQTSEFSLIIATIGLTAGYISRDLFSTFVLLTIVTMTAGTYVISSEKKIYERLSWPLNIFKKMHTRKENLEFAPKYKNRIVIFGCHRIGSLFLKYFAKKKKEILVVDFNPDIIRSLMKKKIHCLYGDFANPEVLYRANLRESEIVVSTIPDRDDNKSLIRKVKEINKKVIVFVTAASIDDAEILYDEGADYVLLPKVITGEKGFSLVKRILNNKKEIKKIRAEQRKHIKHVHKLMYR